jgi:DNA-binding GntR family transcriptional regulator
LYYHFVIIDRKIPKHETIRYGLVEAIASEEYQHEQRLPNEAKLVKSFGASRPTVIRALRELQQASLIERRAVSGSNIKADQPIRGHMAEAQQGQRHVLLKYDSLLSVPLATIHQPYDDMGATAISATMERVRKPLLPARDIVLIFCPVTRESCGARKKGLKVVT